MKITKLKVINLTMLLLALFLSISCSKDTDLLAEYVVSDAEQARLTGNILINDSYVINGKEAIVLDVLSNDILENPEKVKIVETSQPKNGSVIINDDNTLTYVPDGVNEKPETNNPQETPAESEEEEEEEEEPSKDTEEKSKDSFTYTTEIEQEDGKKETEEASVIVSNDFDELKAFPTAEGFGKYATGGRGGRVIKVTNLNDSGIGSLRAAVEANGPRIVVFDVAGDIFLTSPLYIGSSNLVANKEEENITIAGETAPSPGITLRNYGFEIYASNVILRHMNIRPHNDGDDFDCVRVRNWGIDGYILENVMLDHLSMSGGDDENVDFAGGDNGYPARNITIQNCLVAKGTGKYNFLFGQYVQNASILYNVFSHEQSRSVFFGFGYGGESAEMINNIMHANRGNTNIAWGNTVDVIGNIYKSSSQNPPIYRAISYEASTYNNPNARQTEGSVYVADNFQIGNDWNSLPLYQDNVATYGKSTRTITNSLIKSWETTVSGVEAKVLPKVGAYLYRDAIDTALLKDYTAGIGTETNVTPPVKPNTSWPANYDTDGDGIQDSWEINVNGTVGVDDSNGDHDGDGYTNLEEFLHYLAADKFD
ncbi:hypothetical protein [Zobellia galactanivorans]|uniref:hypothetical protein n=1 Tax=Zobellia galactanivorans (strain DSM 12802 / CCUG 47099 / CIP 106680 / NCIMB 13871 / Dsij) TaxID=63186 RepID=UPI001C0686CF|nr:hypothetical protein [Zobellia galactanivorans]MBU3024418.1 hypothetical protein [Zobellia galactanivorans]